MKPTPTRMSAPIRLALATIALVVVALYAGTLNAPLVFDDGPSITDNPTIRQLWPPWAPLFPPQGTGLTVEGRPVLNLSLALNYAVGGVRPASYHVLNGLIHLGAALALFGILRRTLLQAFARGQLAQATGNGCAAGPPATALALAITLLWAAHPLQTESVTYVIQRAESLMGLWYLLTLYCFVRGAELPQATEAASGRARSVWLALSVGACLLGMATKEVMYSAPLIVLLYDRAFLAETFGNAWRQRRRYYVALFSTWLVLASLLVGTGNRGGTAGFGVGVSPWTYAQAEFQAVTHYLWLSFWPHPLIFDYGVRWPDGFGEVFPYALGIIVLVSATVYALVRKPAIGLLGAWFFSILAPTSSFIPGNRQTLAEHRMYLPLAAVLTLAVVVTHQVWVRVRRRERFALGPRLAWFSCFAICCALTVRRNQDYGTAISLYRDTVAKRPDNAFARYNLAQLLDESGEREAAVAEYQAAIRLAPGRAGFHNNLGKTLADLGRWREAIEQYEAALRLAPDYARAHCNLGGALIQTGHKDEARLHLAAAVRLMPDDVEARDNLGGVLLELGRVDEAVEHFETVLRLKPATYEAHYMLGNARLLQGRPAEAIPHYEETLRLQPGLEDARRNLDLARRQLSQK